VQQVTGGVIYFIFYVLPALDRYKVRNFTAFLPDVPLVLVLDWGGGKSDLNTIFMFMQKILSLVQLQLK